MESNKIKKLINNRFFYSLLMLVFLILLGGGVGIGFAIKKEKTVTKIKSNNQEVKELKRAITELEGNKKTRVIDHQKKLTIAREKNKEKQIKLETKLIYTRGILEKKNNQLAKREKELRDKQLELTAAKEAKEKAENQLVIKEAELTAANQAKTTSKKQLAFKEAELAAAKKAKKVAEDQLAFKEAELIATREAKKEAEDQLKIKETELAAIDKVKIETDYLAKIKELKINLQEVKKVVDALYWDDGWFSDSWKLRPNNYPKIGKIEQLKTRLKSLDLTTESEEPTTDHLRTIRELKLNLQAGKKVIDDLFWDEAVGAIDSWKLDEENYKQTKINQLRVKFNSLDLTTESEDEEADTYK